MNTQIKFRQPITKDNNKFSCWHYWGFIGNEFISPAGYGISNKETWFDSDQFTSVVDKKGNDIYQGDIYHQGDKNILYIVTWHDCGFMGKQVKAKGSYSGIKHWKSLIEVIGNIVENPDLVSNTPQ